MPTTEIPIFTQYTSSLPAYNEEDSLTATRNWKEGNEATEFKPRWKKGGLSELHEYLEAFRGKSDWLGGGMATTIHCCLHIRIM